MHVPSSTYRVQFTPSFTFEHARDILSYLQKLGISDLYASPIFKAVKGSSHGYDVVNPTEINPELGGNDSLRKLKKDMDEHGLSWLQDIVPNHMAYDSQNKMLMDVLENGPNSRFMHFFDINWDHFYESLKGRILAPFLGKFYGEALEDGEISLKYDRAGITVNYYELSFPLRIESYVKVFTHNLRNLENDMGENHPELLKFIGTVYTVNDLPSGDNNIQQRYEQIRFTKKMLWKLYIQNEQIKKFIDENLALFNGVKGEPESFNLLDHLLSEQYFRLSFWKVATEEINYRRFFTINNLISLRLEESGVFDHTHSLISQLVKEGVFNGLRIDHIDGLFDPGDYLVRLRDIAPEAYVCVEKILEEDEEIPDDWPVAGTTGYDFLNRLNGLFCYTKHRKKFNRIYSKFSRMNASYATLVAEKKRLMVNKHLAGNIDALAHMMKSISSRNRHGNDITLYGLRRALVEIMAYFPIYRTYINQHHFSDHDINYIRMAITSAKERNPDLMYELRFIEKFLLLKLEDMTVEEKRREVIEFVMRFQQVTGPLMAKGVEDTSMYIYNRLLSLNEVGGSPDVFGRKIDDYHRFIDKRRKRHPYGLNTSATHDTKRGEDTRARINVISELAEEWESSIAYWRKVNRGGKAIRETAIPDRNDEYLLYQTLLGSWPMEDSERDNFLQRVREYMIKAIREAKVHTAWLKPDAEYEKGCIDFLEDILGPRDENEFLNSFLQFQRKVSWYGMFNSLAQTVIKITSPGIPDIYQGNELWDFSMVDPDNRRPVDYKLRKSLLDDIAQKSESDRQSLIDDLLASMEDGRIKIFITYTALNHRKQNKEIYEGGNYIPLKVNGELSENILVFARKYVNKTLLVVVPRFLASVIEPGTQPLGEECWKNTGIEIGKDLPKSYTNLFTGEQLQADNTFRIADILNKFPVAILISRETND